MAQSFFRALISIECWIQKRVVWTHQIHWCHFFVIYKNICTTTYLHVWTFLYIITYIFICTIKKFLCILCVLSFLSSEKAIRSFQAQSLVNAIYLHAMSHFMNKALSQLKYQVILLFHTSICLIRTVTNLYFFFALQKQRQILRYENEIIGNY